MEKLKACRSFFIIDWKMLPLKLHYLLYALAISAVMSYFPLMAKNIGISATAVGIIFTVCPFTTVLTNPVFGWITDKLQRVSYVMIGIIVIQTPLFIGTVFVPSLMVDITKFSVGLICSSENSYAITYPNISSLVANNNKSLVCTTNCFECHLSSASAPDGALCGKDIKFEIGEALNRSSSFLEVTNTSLAGDAILKNCQENATNNCKTLCSISGGSEPRRKKEFVSYEYWTLLVLVVSSITTANACIAIGDAACYEALEGKVNQFGKQRIWLSIGWGAGTMMTGYLLDFTVVGNGGKVDFKYCAYVMLILIVFDIIALSQAKLKKPSASKHIFKDICNVFTRPHPIFFVSATLLIGTFSAILWNYQFWYLEEMGASKLLLGVSTAVACVLVEAPFMFISGWIVKRIGRDNSMVLALLTLAFWFLTVSFIDSPWWILLINLSQGPSYGLFYVAMSSYGKIATAPGTEATMQALLGAVFHGLGIGSGSLLGGVGYDLYGGRITFRSTGFIAVGVAILYKLLTFFVAGENTVVQEKGGGEDATVQQKGDVETKRSMKSRPERF